MPKSIRTHAVNSPFIAIIYDLHQKEIADELMERFERMGIISSSSVKASAHNPFEEAIKFGKKNYLRPIALFILENSAHSLAMVCYNGQVGVNPLLPIIIMQKGNAPRLPFPCVAHWDDSDEELLKIIKIAENMELGRAPRLTPKEVQLSLPFAADISLIAKAS